MSQSYLLYSLSFKGLIRAVGCAVILLFPFSTPLEAQNQDADMVNENQFEISLVNGVTFNRARTLDGPKKMENTIGPEHAFLLRYSRIFSDRWSGSLGVGIGVQAFNFKAEFENFSSDSYKPPLFERMHYNVFLSFEARLNYLHPLRNGNALRWHIGLGSDKYAPLGYTVSASDSQGNETYRNSINYLDSWVSFGSLGLDYLFDLKSRNQFAVGLYYKHKTSFSYFGEFSLDNSTSRGLLYSTGRSFGLSASYIFMGRKNTELKSVY